MKQEAKIKNWSVEIDPYFRDYVLTGEVFDHPKQSEMTSGKRQRTSNLLSVDFEKGTAETKNTKYVLVGPNEAAVGVKNESSKNS